MMTAVAVRQRRYRERARDGRIVLQIEIDAHRVTNWLINAHLLDEADVEDRSKIAAALARLIELSSM